MKKHETTTEEPGCLGSTVAPCYASLHGKRFDLEPECQEGECFDCTEDGEWVRYCDVADLIDSLQMECNLLAKQLNNSNERNGVLRKFVKDIEDIGGFNGAAGKMLLDNLYEA